MINEIDLDKIRLYLIDYLTSINSKDNFKYIDFRKSYVLELKRTINKLEEE